MRVQDLYRAVSNVKVHLGTIKHLMVVTKIGDPNLVPLTRELTVWLLETHKELIVHINENLKEETRFKAAEIEARYNSRIQYWQHDIADHIQVDLIVTMGGDGTVLYAANLFQRRVPVIVPFHLGSLGFLTVFEFDNYKRYLAPLINDGTVLVNLRMRVSCSVYKHPETEDEDAHLRVVDANDSTLSTCEYFKRTYGYEGPTTTTTTTTTEHLEDNADRMEDIGANYPPPPQITMTTPTITFDKTKKNLANIRRSQTPLNACSGAKVGEYQVLNEVVMDRGANAGMIQVDLLADDIPFTTILADGLVIGKMNTIYINILLINYYV
jgi:NAD kinase